MIGQTQLITTLSNYTIDTFPHSVLFTAEQGMGKHTLCQYVATNILKIPLKDITDNLSAALIDEIFTSALPTLYIIDLTKITLSEQNVLLKFVEEPSQYTFVILLCETKNNVLNTLLNRCVSFEFAPYTKEELLQFVKDTTNTELLLSVLHSPGKIKENNSANLSMMKAVCDKIVTQLANANFANALTICTKINYKDEFDKFNPTIFVEMLSNSLFNAFLTTGNPLIYAQYELLLNRRKMLVDARLNLEYFFNNLIVALWKNAKGMA